MQSLVRRNITSIKLYGSIRAETAGHAEASEVKDLKPATMISQAYVFDKDRKYVWTFASYDTESAVFSDRNVFPKCIISKMEKIKI